jgi:small-conductance mechanosensitive channel
MNRAQKFLLLGLLTLALAAMAGLILTSGSAWWEKPTQGAHLSAVAQTLAREEELLRTARTLATFAVTPREQELARNALRLADQELDLAFAEGLRTAGEQSNAQSSSARALQAQIARANADIRTLQDRIKNLTAEEAHAKGPRLAGLQEQVELAQAELGLDQDSLADAQQDLARTGGDTSSEIQRLWEQHQATEHEQGSAQGAVSRSAALGLSSGSSLIDKWRNWRAVRGYHAQVAQARQEALNSTSSVTQEHAALEPKGEAKTEALANSAARANPSPEAASSTNEKAAHLAALHRLSVREKNLADINRRITDLRELTGTYDQWTSVAGGRERAALHSLILSALYIILTILVVWLASRLTEHAFNRVGLERRQLVTLRGVVRFSLKALGIAAALLLIFGIPGNMSTILGLTGAGLTVVLKDFIVSFFGWFTLMGRRGLRVGDWVEINGVRGEVIELNLLHTVLLETGNWTEPGHPTGRQVTFLNSYAVEGYYFNFRTAGQWLWDEITVHIPSGVDPYPVIEQIERVVAGETGSSAKTAEEEWQRATHAYSVKSFTAAPAINVRSTKEGVEVSIRYITRANERYAQRLRLSNAAVKLIQEAKAAVTPSAHAPAKSREEVTQSNFERGGPS